MRQENLERKKRERKVNERQAALEAQVQEVWLEFREKKRSTPERKPVRFYPIPKPQKEQPESLSTIEQPPSQSRYNQWLSVSTLRMPPLKGPRIVAQT